MVKIIDRRDVALGGQSRDRSESNISSIAWHYTAVDRKRRAFITNHENYWRNTRGWRRGGYHYYIDADANIYQNYNLTTVSNGVGGHNSKIVNICVEANSADNYTKAQEDARRDLTLYLMNRLNLTANDVKQHKEFPGQSTSCAGYSRSQMDKLLNELRTGKAPSSDGGDLNKPYSGNSIVNYLKSNGEPHTFSARCKLADKFKIKNYKGTAEQNIELLKRLRGAESNAGADPSRLLTVDGLWGKETTTRLQEALGTEVDGVISKPSQMVIALQKLIGSPVDGMLGPVTYKYLQRYLGTTVDGVISKPSLAVIEMQKRLNAGTFLNGKGLKKKSAKEVAQEIVFGKNYGGWGVGESRRKKLTNAGYNASEVQRNINNLVRH